MARKCLAEVVITHPVTKRIAGEEVREPERFKFRTRTRWTGLVVDKTGTDSLDLLQALDSFRESREDRYRVTHNHLFVCLYGTHTYLFSTSRWSITLQFINIHTHGHTPVYTYLPTVIPMAWKSLGRDAPRATNPLSGWKGMQAISTSTRWWNHTSWSTLSPLLRTDTPMSLQCSVMWWPWRLDTRHLWRIERELGGNAETSERVVPPSPLIISLI